MRPSTLPASAALASAVGVRAAPRLLARSLGALGSRGAAEAGAGAGSAGCSAGAGDSHVVLASETTCEVVAGVEAWALAGTTLTATGLADQGGRGPENDTWIPSTRSSPVMLSAIDRRHGCRRSRLGSSPAPSSGAAPSRVSLWALR